MEAYWSKAIGTHPVLWNVGLKPWILKDLHRISLFLIFTNTFVVFFLQYILPEGIWVHAFYWTDSSLVFITVPLFSENGDS